MNPSFVRIQPLIGYGPATLSGLEGRTIFQIPEWLSFVAKSQGAEIIQAALKDGSQLIGYFAGLIVRKLGLKILGSPLPGWTTSYMGLNLAPNVPRPVAVQALIRFAFDDLGCAHMEMMDRHLTVEDVKRLGLQHRIFAGFEIDLSQSEDRLFANMSSACRRCIRKAEKNGVTIEEAHDKEFADEYYEQLQDVFGKRHLVPTYDVNRVRDLIACMDGTNHLLLLRARDPNGRCIATGIFPALNGTMHFWGGASRQDSLAYRPNEALHWYGMKYWKARGMRLYDMGGGGEYKRKFGGYQIHVPWVRASKYFGISLIRELTKYMVYWRQSACGWVRT